MDRESDIVKHRLGINHLRVLKKYAGTEDVRLGHVEFFLQKFVSQPTARKIIEDLILMKFVISEMSNTDKRVRLLSFGEVDIDNFL